MEKSIFLETTLHNIYFHDSSSIFSITQKNGFLYTCGSDKVIRKWKIIINERKDEFKYSTALNSGIKLEYIDQLEGHTSVINCIRYDKYLASCSDTGEIFLWYDKQHLVLNSCNKDEALDLCWGNGRLYVGFENGKVFIYEINEKSEVNHEKIKNIKDRFDFKLVFNKNVHKSCIEGIYYNPAYDIFVTQTRNAALKVCKFDQKIKYLSTFDNIFIGDTAGILFRRGAFSNDGTFLYLTCSKDNYLYIISYPFTKIYGRIGKFDSPVTNIIAYKGKMIFLTKRSLYLMDNGKFHGLEYLTMTPITDVCIFDDILFVSAFDGFVYSVNINKFE